MESRYERDRKENGYNKQRRKKELHRAGKLAVRCVGNGGDEMLPINLETKIRQPREDDTRENERW